MILGLTVAAAAFVLDQLSKWYVADFFLKNIPSVAFGKYFSITEAWNTGVSFSMFNEGGIWGTVLLSVFALIVVFFLLSWLKNEPNRLIQASLGLIIGGALGNVCDRVRFGAVYDFLDFHYNSWSWPVFNLADSFICIGAFLIIAHSLLSKKQSLKEAVK